MVANYEYWTYPEFSTTAANLNLPILFTTITDNNGIYHTEIPAQPPSRPLITIASKEGHATVFPNSFSFMSPTTGYYPTPGDSLYLDKNSYIQFRINNTAPVSNQDTFFIRRRNIHTNDWIFGIAPDRFNVYFGAVNNIIIDSVSAKQFPKVEIEWRVYNNGLRQKKYRYNYCSIFWNYIIFDKLLAKIT